MYISTRVLFGSLQGEERNPSFCEKNQTLHALIRQLGASSGDPLQLEARVDQGEGFPDPSLLWRPIKNPEEWCFGDFLGLPKESFNDTFDPFGGFVRSKLELLRRRRKARNPELHPLHPLLHPERRLVLDLHKGLVGDTPLEETVESDSERGE
ncbi:hypothetical protein Taro_004494 [Colocasia esculenta]|uniref:Uncharacterized protein n=1 Tax=Colocasia esculenta TaxID=4460 RepID=A0A843TRT2_COLES|nr:hypothetical protein [Colocasia esculenta]